MPTPIPIPADTPTITPPNTSTPLPTATTAATETPDPLLRDSVNVGDWLASDQTGKIGAYFATYWRNIGLDVPLTDEEMQLCLQKKAAETTPPTMALSGLAADCICEYGPNEACEPTAEATPETPPASVPFPDLDRNTEAYLNQEIILNGTAIQVIEDGQSYTVRLAVDDQPDQIVLILCFTENRILENDRLTVIGLVMGRETMQTVLGQPVTLPWVFAQSCTIN